MEELAHDPLSTDKSVLGLPEKRVIGSWCIAELVLKVSVGGPVLPLLDDI